MKPFQIVCAALALALCGALDAGAAEPARQSLAELRARVERLVREQTAGLPGKVSFMLGTLDPRLDLPACPVPPQAFVPPGSRLWGNTAVGVRCPDGRPWQIYVPVDVTILSNVVVSARPLPSGQQVQPSDVTLQAADLTQLPPSVLTDPAQAVGRTLTIALGAGEPLRLDLLRSPPVIRQGQTVTLLTRGPGFRVSAEGVALSTAAAGGLAQVRVASGRTVSGLAEPGGIVAVSY